MYYLTRATLYCTFIEPLRGKPNKWRPVWTQMEEVGVKSTTIVFLVSFLIGVILAFQSAHQLSRLGALEFVGALVGVAILRELGALETMALNPVKFLITPRFLALLITLPCLTIMVDRLEIYKILSEHEQEQLKTLEGQSSFARNP